MASILTKIQRDIIVGTILGDACIEPLKKESRIQITHSEKQKEYVEWKYKHFREWVFTSPKEVVIRDKRYHKTHYLWRFRTISHPEFSYYRNIFYLNGKKIIPENIEDILKSPLSLAVWYMDDGKKRPDCRGAYLDTICFPAEEQERLMKCLEINFGIKDTRLHWNGEGYHIYIPYVSIDRFKMLIEKFIIPSMVYKLPYARNDFLPLRRR